MQDQQLANYDSSKGWENTNMGWYETAVVFDPNGHVHYTDLLDWLYNQIDNCEKHSRWGFVDGIWKVKFRYERDFIWFRLVWG